MASIFDSTDDPPKKGTAVRETRILPPPNLSEIRRLANRRLIPEQIERATARRESTQVDPMALPNAEARKTMALVEAENKRIKDERSVGGIELNKQFPAQSAIARSASWWSNISSGGDFDPEMYDKAMMVMDYMFAPLDTAEKWEDYRKWAMSGASYEDMPPGAMSPELMVGVTPFANDAQALRDIWKDLKHGQQNWATALDAASLIPMAGLMFGMIKKGGGDDIAKLANRLYRKAQVAEGVGLTRVLPAQYGSGHYYVFATPKGNIVAQITEKVNDAGMPEAYVDIIHRQGTGINAGQAQAMGRSAMMEIGGQVHQLFPGHQIGGFRVSGMRAHSTGRGSARTTRDLAFFPPPATDELLEANAEVFDLVNAKRAEKGEAPITREALETIRHQRGEAFRLRDDPSQRGPIPMIGPEHNFHRGQAEVFEAVLDATKQYGPNKGLKTRDELGITNTRIEKIDDETYRWLFTRNGEEKWFDVQAPPLTSREHPKVQIIAASDNMDKQTWQKLKAADEYNGIALGPDFEYPPNMQTRINLGGADMATQVRRRLIGGESPRSIMDDLGPDVSDMDYENLHHTLSQTMIGVRDNLVNDGWRWDGWGDAPMRPPPPPDVNAAGQTNLFSEDNLTEAGPRTRRPRESEVAPSALPGNQSPSQVINGIDILEDYWDSVNLDPVVDVEAARMGWEHLESLGYDSDMAREIAQMDSTQRAFLFDRAMDADAGRLADVMRTRYEQQNGHPPPPELVMQNLQAMGTSEDGARRAVGLGAEAQGEQIGGTEEMIGARPFSEGASTARRGDALGDYRDIRGEFPDLMAGGMQERMRNLGYSDGQIRQARLDYGNTIHILNEDTVPMSRIVEAIEESASPIVRVEGDAMTPQARIANMRNVAMREVVDRDGASPYEAAQRVIRETDASPEEAVIAVNSAMDEAGYGAPTSWTRNPPSEFGVASMSEPQSPMERLRQFWSDQSGEVTKQMPGGQERRAAPRGDLPEATVERAARMAEDWDIPLEKTGAEPAHWEAVRRAARGEGGDIDLDQMADVQERMGQRGMDYGDVAQPGARIRAETSAEDFHAAIQRAERVNPDVAPNLTPRTLDEWRELQEGGAKLILNENGTAGVAVLPDGEIANGFNAGGPSGVFREVLLPEAVRRGGRSMNWFDGELTEMYSPFVKETRRVANTTEGGPDVVYGEVNQESLAEWGGMSERELTAFRRQQIEGDPEAMEAFTQDYLSGLNDAERARYENGNRGVKRGMLNSALQQMTPEEMAPLVGFGAPNRGWYEGVNTSNAAAALRATFGEDAYQYAGLLAATSPNVPVPANSRFASDMFTEWIIAGRPRDEEGIRAIFDMVRANEGPNTTRQSFTGGGSRGQDITHQVETSAWNNTLFVLGHEDPVGHFSNPASWVSDEALGLSGPKVNPFLSNLLGEMRRFTNDTHMTRGSAQKYNNLSNRAAQTSTYTRAGSHMEEVLGLAPGTVLAANAQEQGWEVLRQLGEMSGRGRRGIEELLFPDGVNMDLDVMAEVDRRVRTAAAEGGFDSLMQNEETARNLQRAGFTPENAPPVERGLGSPEADEAAQAWATSEENWPHWRRLARRMDMHYQGDYLAQAAPWLAGGAAAHGARRLLPGQEEQGQQTPALFQGASLLPLGQAPNNAGGRPDDGGVARLLPRPIVQ